MKRMIGFLLVGLLANGYALADDDRDAAERIEKWRHMAQYGAKHGVHAVSFAQYKLGQAHLNGEGVARDEGEAVWWLRTSAQRGYAPAQFLLHLDCTADVARPRGGRNFKKRWAIYESQGLPVCDIFDKAGLRRRVDTGAGHSADSVYLEARKSFTPELVVVLFGDHRRQPGHPDAVAAHRQAHRLAVLTEHVGGERIGVLATELEHVSDLDAPRGHQGARAVG